MLSASTDCISLIGAITITDSVREKTLIKSDKQHALNSYQKPNQVI